MKSRAELESRIAELEEALQELANMGSMLWIHVYGCEGGAWVQRGDGSDFSGFEANHVDGKTAADAIVALVEKKPWRSTTPQASTEQTSPSPSVVEAARRVNDLGTSNDFCALETALEQLEAKAKMEKVTRE